MNLFQKQLGILFTMVAFISSSFTLLNETADMPKPITQSVDTNDRGEQIRQTIILIDQNTSREDLIHTCRFLAKDNVQLTFEELEIRKYFWRLLGKKRIARADGKILLPDGNFEAFKAGGIISFRSIEITYTKNLETEDYYIEMIEIID